MLVAGFTAISPEGPRFLVLRFAPAGKGGFILDGTGCARECA
jgi:hypothetical protein